MKYTEQEMIEYLSEPVDGMTRMEYERTEVAGIVMSEICRETGFKENALRALEKGLRKHKSRMAAAVIKALCLEKSFEKWAQKRQHQEYSPDAADY